MGTKLQPNMAAHPQIDGQSERAIQILEDMLRTYVIEFRENWDKHLSLVEFTYNNSYQSTSMPPFETSYGRRRRSPICWEEVRDRRILGLGKIKLIKEKVKAAQSGQNDYIYKCCS